MIATYVLEACAAGACLLSCAVQTPVNTTAQGHTNGSSTSKSSVSSTETRTHFNHSSSSDANSIKLDFIPVTQRIFRDELGLGRLQSPRGTYGVEAHGTPDFIESRTGRPISPAELAEWIHRDPRYSPGMPIYLFACETGNGTHSYAQRLANVMKVTVVAPDTRIWVQGGGDFEVSGATYKRALGIIPLGDAMPDHAQRGNMKTFQPATFTLADVR